jgi:hypothetical protein
MNSKTIRTWRIKGKGGGDHNIKSHEYFIKNNCLSCGWSFPDNVGRIGIVTLDDYKRFWLANVKGKKWGIKVSIIFSRT